MYEIYKRTSFMTYGSQKWRQNEMWLDFHPSREMYYDDKKS